MRAILINDCSAFFISLAAKFGLPTDEKAYVLYERMFNAIVKGDIFLGRDIAVAIGVSKDAVYQWNRRMKLRAAKKTSRLRAETRRKKQQKLRQQAAIKRQAAKYAKAVEFARLYNNSASLKDLAELLGTTPNYANKRACEIRVMFPDIAIRKNSRRKKNGG